jgi:hypothetical protein
LDPALATKVEETMKIKTLWVATLGAALAMAAISTKANAHPDPVAGAVVGTAIGAAVGGPVGAAVGALLGTAIASEPYYHRRNWDGNRDRHGRYDGQRGYDRGYDRGYGRGGYAPPVRYERYEPRTYREARYEPAPRFYDAPRYESRQDRYYGAPRYESRQDRYYDERRDAPYYGSR